MRVAEVHIEQHPVFNDLRLDFRGADGHAARMVVIAGVNGCGKTLLLEALFQALCPERQPGIISTDASVGSGFRVLVEASEELTLPLPPSPPMSRTPPNYEHPLVDEDSREFSIWVPVDDQCQHGTPSLHRKLAGGGWVGLTVPATRWQTSCFYSEANVTFAVPQINQAHAANAERIGFQHNAQHTGTYRGGANLAGEVTQSLINLAAADAEDLSLWCRQNPGLAPPPAMLDKRWTIFSNAFALMFPKKRLSRLERHDQEYRVMFEESGRRSSIAQLSTGEKQIVFRGAFLLRKLDEIPGSIVLVDEPELSLHPNWQSRIVAFYETLVTETDSKTSQIILATHSPFVVHGSITAKHTVLHRDPTTDKVGVLNTPSYPGITSADVAVAAFDLSSFLRDARGEHLALIVEGSTDRRILEEAWRKLRGTEPMPFLIRAADGARNISRLLGIAGDKTGPLVDTLTEAGTVLVGLFDFDQEGLAQWNGAIPDPESEPIQHVTTVCQVRKRRDASVWGALLPVPISRAGYASPGLGSDSRLTIELIFPDEFSEPFLERVPVAGDIAGTRLVARTKSQKENVAAAATSFPQDAFLGFKPIFDLLAQIIGHQS